MSNIVLNLFRYFEYIVNESKKIINMQNYAEISDIDHYSLHTVFIISVIM